MRTPEIVLRLAATAGILYGVACGTPSSRLSSSFELRPTPAATRAPGEKLMTDHERADRTKHLREVEHLIKDSGISMQKDQAFWTSIVGLATTSDRNFKSHFQYIDDHVRTFRTWQPTGERARVFWLGSSSFLLPDGTKNPDYKASIKVTILYWGRDIGNLVIEMNIDKGSKIGDGHAVNPYYSQDTLIPSDLSVLTSEIFSQEPQALKDASMDYFQI